MRAGTIAGLSSRASLLLVDAFLYVAHDSDSQGGGLFAGVGEDHKLQALALRTTGYTTKHSLVNGRSVLSCFDEVFQYKSIRTIPIKNHVKRISRAYKMISKSWREGNTNEAFLRA